MAYPVTSIRLDPKLKRKIKRIAREMGVSFSDIIKMALTAIVQGKWHLGPTEYPPKFIAELERETEKTERLFKEGKLKLYDTVDEAFDDILKE